MKRFIFDMETTGTLPGRHGVHQLAGKIVLSGMMPDPNNKFLPPVKYHTEIPFNWRVRPNPLADIDEKALEVSNVTKEQILAYTPMEIVFKELIALLDQCVDKFDKKDKLHLVGYNNRWFDDNFLRGFFLQNNHNYFGSYFWADSIDVMVLASLKLENIRHTMENFKLQTVAMTLGIPIDLDKLHDAMYDIYLTEQVLFKLQQM